MKAYLQVLSVSAVSAAASAVLLSLWIGQGPAVVADQVPDSITVGSTPPAGVFAPQISAASPPAVFSVSNFSRKTVCLVERGATLTSRSRDFFAPPDCESVWPGLARATNWTQNEDGSVTLSTVHGAPVLTLVRGKSFSYEVADPAEADLALLMVP
ncbi:hypothetical protein [Rhizobium glycinendophyticum]|uniref:Alkaline proteinase inhibitor/ Outer membrane lipoprotein Omp19 domain-containing protein n=1 Tax=Rhizobium glycinendophyticum TaxID=2589807 RepID=A0A504TWD6_9HYPH|nr:hypothetical protein [Rhizobium glycinendophyticum]TPP06519.1 hypothetical protein FJQ55_17365 [Rhizobium glycinendophyticum]